VETTEILPSQIKNDDFRVIDSFSPDYVVSLSTLITIGKLAEYGYSQNNPEFNWDKSKSNSLFQKYIDSVLGPNNKHSIAFRNFVDDSKNEKISDLIKKATFDTMKIRREGGANFTDFDMFLIISKRIMTASRVYSNAKPLDLEMHLKNILKDILLTTNMKITDYVLDPSF